jgi:hypothetical protein
VVRGTFAVVLSGFGSIWLISTLFCWFTHQNMVVLLKPWLVRCIWPRQIWWLQPQQLTIPDSHSGQWFCVILSRFGLSQLILIPFCWHQCQNMFLLLEPWLVRCVWPTQIQWFQCQQLKSLDSHKWWFCLILSRSGSICQISSLFINLHIKIWSLHSSYGLSDVSNLDGYDGHNGNNYSPRFTQWAANLYDFEWSGLILHLISTLVCQFTHQNKVVMLKPWLVRCIWLDGYDGCNCNN